MFVPSTPSFQNLFMHVLNTKQLKEKKTKTTKTRSDIEEEKKMLGRRMDKKKTGEFV